MSKDEHRQAHTAVLVGCGPEADPHHVGVGEGEMRTGPQPGPCTPSSCLLDGGSESSLGPQLTQWFLEGGDVIVTECFPSPAKVKKL